MSVLSKLFHSKKPRVRIAPSPTGALHIGTARTALFNWIFAEKYGGDFILRLEDTDTKRSKKTYEENITEGLRWLGLRWDEQYRQSERSDIYTTYITQLYEKGIIFRCPHKSESRNTDKKSYAAGPHTCEYRNKKSVEGIFRFRNDEKDSIIFHDIIRGGIKTDPATLGDFSVAIALDRPLFLLAGVVDDYDMHITHVIRGEDHISNTPKQILLQRSLRMPVPQYAHLPLILGPDKSKLSKRHGARSLLEYRDDGYLPDAMFNFLALLGWHPETNDEIFSKDKLVRQFSLERMQKGGAIFNSEKLNWINKQYIGNLRNEELAELLIPYLIKEKLLTLNIKENSKEITSQIYQTKNNQKITFTYIVHVAALEKSRLKTLLEIGNTSSFFFADPIYNASLLAWKGKQSPETVAQKLDTLVNILQKIPVANFTQNELEGNILPVAEKEGKGELLWPLRAALSGKRASPGPFEILAVLGKEQSLKRLREAIRHVRAYAKTTS